MTARAERQRRLLNINMLSGDTVKVWMWENETVFIQDGRWVSAYRYADYLADETKQWTKRRVFLSAFAIESIEPIGGTDATA